VRIGPPAAVTDDHGGEPGREKRVYWTLGIIYLVLTVAFIADVLRNAALTAAGKALWIVVLIVVPVFAWLVYGILRLRESRGL